MSKLTSKLLAALDGSVELALLCGSKEPVDPAYSRQSVQFSGGTNSTEAKFGPYEQGFRSAITHVKACWDDFEYTFKVTPQTPAEAETTTVEVGSLGFELD